MIGVGKAQNLLYLQNVATLQIERLLTAQANLKHATETASLRPYNQIPGPNRFETLRSFLPGGQFYDKSTLYFSQALRQKYGDIYRIPGMFGKPDTVHMFNTEDYEKVFRNEGQWPIREGFETIKHFRQKIKPEFFKEACGIIVDQNEAWFQIRSLVNPVMMQPRATKPYIKPLFHISQEFIKLIKEIRDPQKLEVPKNFEAYINRLTFESLALVAVNARLGLLQQNNLNPKVLKYFENTRRLLILLYHLDYAPSMWKVIGTPKYYESMRIQAEIFETTDYFVQKALKELEKKEQSGGTQAGNLSIFEKMLKINRKFAMIMAMDMFFLGIDTTSASVMAILLCLAKHPEKQEKLHAEILNILPTKDTELTEHNMKDMPYLRAVIKESMRYYPNSTGTFRNASVDMSLSGYHIPKGTRVVINSNLLMKDEKYFPRSKEFLPERWLRDSDKRKLDINPFTFMPFGIGPRSCIGKRLVDAELEVSIASLVRNFKIEFNYPADEPFRAHFVNAPQIPMQFKFVDVKD